jgi:hypothetical protein
LGIDVLTVKELLGHASLDTTLRYLHKKEDNLKQAIAKMSSWASGGSRHDDDTAPKAITSKSVDNQSNLAA